MHAETIAGGAGIKHTGPRAPRLLADVGGTNVRFALESVPGRFEAPWLASCRSYPTLEAALAHYLAQADSVAAGAAQVRAAAIAIATPVEGDMVRMTNHHWQFSIAALRIRFGWDTLLVVNDFKALANALPLLSPQQKRQVGGVAAKAGAAIGLLGPGTGLGVSALLPAGERWLALDSEGGHGSFSPVNEGEIAILHFARRRHFHVSFERLLSGPGLVLIYDALAEQAGGMHEKLAAPEILERGLQAQDPLCGRTLEMFCEMLGTLAANLAITFGARGGMYIGGGIVPRMGDYFAQSGFRLRFEQKGRFSGYLAQIPVWVITEAQPTLIGLAALLAQALP